MADAIKKKKMTVLIAGTAVMVAALVAAYVFFFAKANPALPRATVRIGDAAFDAEIASTMASRARGLSYRSGLGDGQAMLFIFDRPAVQNFWMKDMNFPLDMIWIGGNTVLGFAENVVPQPGVPLWGLNISTSPDGTDKVLEVVAGTVEKDGITIGDAVVIGQSK